MLRITEVHVDVGRQREALVIGHLPDWIARRNTLLEPLNASIERSGLFRYRNPLQRQGGGFPALHVPSWPRPLLRKVSRWHTKADVSDMMRRMVKEELLRFDGTPLFLEP